MITAIVFLMGPLSVFAEGNPQRMAERNQELFGNKSRWCDYERGGNQHNKLLDDRYQTISMPAQMEIKCSNFDEKGRCTDFLNLSLKTNKMRGALLKAVKRENLCQEEEGKKRDQPVLCYESSRKLSCFKQDTTLDGDCPECRLRTGVNADCFLRIKVVCKSQLGSRDEKLVRGVVAEVLDLEWEIQGLEEKGSGYISEIHDLKSDRRQGLPVSDEEIHQAIAKLRVVRKKVPLLREKAGKIARAHKLTKKDFRSPLLHVKNPSLGWPVLPTPAVQ